MDGSLSVRACASVWLCVRLIWFAVWAQGLGGAIAGLNMKQWFVCSNEIIEYSFGLQVLEVSLPQMGQSADGDVCSDGAKQLVGGSDVPCDTGKIGFALGIAAAVLIGLGMVFGVTIACTRRLGGMWGAALACNLLGGLAGVASGAVYVGIMVAETSDAVLECKYLLAAPILMVAGQSDKRVVPSHGGRHLGLS